MKNKDWLFRVANSLGCKVAFSNNSREATYNKGVIYLDFSPFGLVHDTERNTIGLVEALAHELGHFVIAPRGRRYRKNYGILTTNNRNHDHWNLDEEKALLVEGALLRHVGLKGMGLIDLTYEKRVMSWWEQQGKHIVQGLLLIK
jgi:hypothetical protein